jgi:hypothetical protein
LPEVAAVVAAALRSAGFDAVLTGGACATIYTRGAYQSYDLDFIVRAGGNRHDLDEAMARIGFARDGDQYTHPATTFFVEFPRGPLAIGEDIDIRPVEIRIGRGGRTLALSATDACRDRLAAFYHWSDRQSLQSAIEIARRHRVKMATIERWSAREGASDRFEEFRAALRQRVAATTVPAPAAGRAAPRRRRRSRRRRTAS